MGSVATSPHLGKAGYNKIIASRLSNVYNEIVITVERLAPHYFKQGYVGKGSMLPLTFLVSDLTDFESGVPWRNFLTLETICRVLQHEHIVQFYKNDGVIYPCVVPQFQMHLFALPSESLVKALLDRHSTEVNALAERPEYRTPAKAAAEQQQRSSPLQQLRLL